MPVDMNPRRRSRIRRVALAAIVIVLLLLPLVISSTQGASGQPTVAAAERDGQPEPSAFQGNPSADQQLADRYAPVTYLRQVNNDICDTDNEGFDPLPVDFVLGREEIPLLVSENGLPSGRWLTVAESPTAEDLYGLEQPHFLNFPGSPVRPGCVYRRYEAQRTAAENTPRVAYAHILKEPGYDELVLQYWFFYYFNDWNNQHEGDWEMIMLFFDADDVEEALTMEPTRVIYAQHAGGERADWDDEKFSKEDGHPVVYVARGAHASFFEQNTYFGLAEEGTGFGCETTKGPHRRFQTNAIVVPHAPTGPDDPFAWLNFTGRWGEFRRSEWNGPTGPNDKTSWTEPVSWASRQRDSSIIVPEFEGFGQSPVNVFCGVVAGGSRVLVAFTQKPAVGTGVLALVVVLIGWIFSYTSQSIRQAYSYYKRHFRTFAVIGALLIPIAYLLAVIQTLLFRIPPIGPFINMMERFPGIRVAMLLAVGGVQAALAILIVSPAVIWTMTQMRSGRTPGVVDSYRGAARSVWPILVARVRVGIRVMLYGITIVGLPWAVLTIVRASFLAQAVINEGDDAPAAIFDSSTVAGVNLRRTWMTQMVLSIITMLTGPLIAIFVLLALPSRPLGLVNYIGSLIFAFVYPLGVIGMTLLYYQQRPDELPSPEPTPAPSVAPTLATEN